MNMQNDSPVIDRHALYRMIWRWHFYAGLFCIPLVIMLSITGAIYLFKPQIEAWQDSPFKNLALSETRKTPNEHIAAALNTLPNAKFHNYRLPQEESDAIVVSVFSDEVRYLVYVNPFDLSVLNIKDYESSFIRIVQALHGELMIGNVGSVLVELAACWAIVLIISGLYLWWPRSPAGLGGVLYPRLHDGNRRFWKDLHSVTGIWVSFFALFLLLSGLPWALVWGSAFKEARAFSQQLTQQEWSTGKQQQIQSWRSNAVEKYDLTPALLTSAMSQNFAPPAELSVSDEEKNLWKLSSMSQNRPLRTNAWINGDDGQVTKIKGFAGKKIADKVIGVGIAAHEGQLFGWFNQLLGLLTTIALITLSTTGFILWQKRKPKKKLGAPPAMAKPALEKVIIGIVCVGAIFLPMLFISLVVLFLTEQLLLKRLPVVRDWLGINN